MRQDNRQGVGAAALCGVLPVVWLALLTAPYLAGGSDRGIPESNGSAIPDQDMRGQCENCPHFSVDVRAWNRHLSFYTKELPERGGTWFGSVGKCTGSE